MLSYVIEYNLFKALGYNEWFLLVLKQYLFNFHIDFHETYCNDIYI